MNVNKNKQKRREISSDTNETRTALKRACIWRAGVVNNEKKCSHSSILHQNQQFWFNVG